MINYSIFSNHDSYSQYVVDLIGKLEADNLQPVPKDIGDGKATIGFGYTFNRNDNLSIWTNAGISLTQAQKDILTKIDNAANVDKTYIATHEFTKSITLVEAKDLLKYTYTKYESVANSLFIPESIERAVIVSLTYNRGADNVFNKMPDFISAIADGNRAEAWYQIRYNAQTDNPEFKNGIANRRYVESERFGLYDDHSSYHLTTPTEANSIAQMYTQHRLEILSYESLYKPSAAAIAKAEPSIQDIYHEMQPAITALENEFHVPTSFVIEEVQMLDQSQFALINDLSGDGTAYDGTNNDQDLLIGNSQNNNLDGGAGNDALVGGGGDYTLTGGTGNNIFVFNNGDGKDTITDASDNDKIIFNGTTVTGSSRIVDEDLYQMSDGKLLLKEGNDLFVSFGGQAGVTIKNFFNQFSHTYDPKVDYTLMGITIPAFVDKDGDGVDDNLEGANAPSYAVKAARMELLYATGKASIVDPLIIDLNNNGIALNSWQTSGVLFDLNGDNVKDKTGWTKANSDDAFLVIDKNNNGKIDNINEMFGNSNTKGFNDLASYDSNGDHVINASDAQFSLLRLWNDKNANGIVDSGEMTTLAANGITSISLNTYYKPAEISGNIQDFVSTVTKTDGTTRNINEFSFAIDSAAFTSNPDLKLPSTFQLNISTLVLPYSRGYGNLYSWQAAMTLDPTLLAMAQDMMATAPKDLDTLHDKFENFLYRWAGVENVKETDVYIYTSGVHADPRKIAFLEKLTGEDYIYNNHNAEPVAMQAWEMFFNEFLDRFLVQGPLASAFPHATYDFATDSLKFNDTLETIPRLERGSRATPTAANDNLLVKINYLLTTQK